MLDCFYFPSESKEEDAYKYVSENMNNVDPAFKTIPKNSSAFLIWRIENMKVVPIPKEQYGKFFTGDSYIVYAATEYGKPGGTDVKVREVRGTSIEVHVHFWLGLETSQDEAGVAAYKTVELDDYLGGGPVQHREVEGKESARFRSYFKNGITLMKGGAASGFNHVTDTFEPSLFRVKGKRTPTVTQMASIAWEHFNSGDIFILQTKEIVFVWVGRTANNMEKIQAAKVAQQLKTERSGSSAVFVDDGREQALKDVERRYWEKFLPLKSRDVKPAETAGEDEAVEENTRSSLRLYHCSDQGGTLKVTEVKSGPLFQADLNSDDSFIVDNGVAGIWVWVGKRASNKERVEAMRNAHGFVKKKNYPTHTPVTRVIDGGEPVEFKMLFQSWKDPNQTTGITRQFSNTKIARTVQTKFDAETLHEQPKLAAESQMVDDGSGQKEVWRVENFELVPVPTQEHGRFFSGDCYVILYTYSVGGSSGKYILYYWLGLHSAQDERGAAALKTIEKDDELGGAAVQVRVLQGKEPTHFMAIFGGKMAIFNGGKASSFDGDAGQDVGIPSTYLLQVRGNSKNNTKATQVELRAASLNSNDVFVLVTRGMTFVWCGKGSTGDEREMAKHIASATAQDHAVVYEGQEKNDFWDAIGGKEEYASDKRLADSNEQLPARLFQCSNASGNFKVEEIVNFTQTDLVSEDVMLLDARESIFLWTGKDSNKDEKKQAVNTAIDYLKTDPSGRDEETPILIVKQGFEPPNFTGFFGVWDIGLWNNYKTFDELRSELQDSNPVLQVDLEDRNGSLAFNDFSKYPMEALLEKDPEKLPTDVDPTMKEVYLSAADFNTAFGMEFGAFETLPAWKKQQLKKKVGLF